MTSIVCAVLHILWKLIYKLFILSINYAFNSLSFFIVSQFTQLPFYTIKHHFVIISIHYHTTILPTNTTFIKTIIQSVHNVHPEGNTHLHQLSTKLFKLHTIQCPNIQFIIHIAQKFIQILQSKIDLNLLFTWSRIQINQIRIQYRIWIL